MFALFCVVCTGQLSRLELKFGFISAPVFVVFRRFFDFGSSLIVSSCAPLFKFYKKSFVFAFFALFLMFCVVPCASHC